MIIYLYIKTHTITGLKYLGKTNRKNPHAYRGSGIDWLQHLSDFGNFYTTQILKVCNSQQELNYWGKYYSKFYNIVSAMDDFGYKIWANKIPETGGGALYGDSNPSKRKDVKTKKALRMEEKRKKGYISPLKNKPASKNHPMQRKEVIDKISGDNHYTKRTDYVSHIKGEKNPVHKPEIKQKIKQRCLEIYGVENVAQSKVIMEKRKQNNKSKYDVDHPMKLPKNKLKIAGDNHYTKKQGFISKTKGIKKPESMKEKLRNTTVYCWINVKTNEVINLTQSEMVAKTKSPSGVSSVINGNQKTVKGWKLNS